jgi:alkylhydroperoxidase/carboxymuconolactone decarboxylase family protein YurZ
MKDSKQTAASDRFKQGISALEGIELDIGNAHGLLHGMRVHAPAFKQRVIELFGDCYAGEQAIPTDTKLLMAVALSACQPEAEGVLEFHVGAALKAGWSERQIVDAIELAAFFSGWQRAIRAVQIAIACFEKIDVQAGNGGQPE